MTALGSRSGELNGRYRHGGAMLGTSEYTTWKGMRDRCNNPRSRQYKDYGGRGIKVCTRWADFANFLADVGPKPDPEMTIERRDNNGGYTPSNCAWATRSAQNLNRRNTIRIEFAGKLITAKQAAAILGVDVSTIRWRLRNGRAWNEGKV